MSPKATGVVLLVVGVFDWLTRETIKTVFFDRVVHTMSPNANALVEYGPPLAFAGFGLYFLWKATVPKSQRTRRYMISVLVMVAGGIVFSTGAFMFRAETGHFPFLGGEAEHEPKSGHLLPPPSASGAPAEPITPTNPAPPPAPIEQRPPASIATPAKPATSPYYTRKEIDGLLDSLGALQQFFKNLPATSEAIASLTARRTGVLQAPPLEEYNRIADGIDQYAQQLMTTAAELQKLASGTDDFVRSALPENIMSKFLPFKDSLEVAARRLRHIAKTTSDGGTARMALGSDQQQIFDEYMKFSLWITSTKKTIAEKISDLRGRDIRP